MKRTPIFENAVDSLNHGIASYLIRNEHETAIKHSILFVYHSIELFLKEALSRIHPSLIYRNIDKPIRDDSVTVSLDEALARLANFHRGLSVDEAETLTELRKRRNRIEHHRFDPAKDHAVVVGQAFHFLMRFLPAHIGVNLRDLVEEDSTYSDLVEAAVSWEQRIVIAEQEAKRVAGFAENCPICGQAAMCEQHGGFHCYMCNEDIDMQQCKDCGEPCYEPALSSRGLCSWCEAERE